MPPPNTDCHLNENPLVTGGPALATPPPGETTMPSAFTVYSTSFRSPSPPQRQGPVEARDDDVRRILRAHSPVLDRVGVVAHRVRPPRNPGEVYEPAVVEDDTGDSLSLRAR